MATSERAELAEMEGRLIQFIAEERTIRREDMAQMEGRIKAGIEVELIKAARSLSGEIETVNAKVDQIANRVENIEGKVDQIIERLDSQP